MQSPLRPRSATRSAAIASKVAWRAATVLRGNADAFHARAVCETSVPVAAPTRRPCQQADGDSMALRGGPPWLSGRAAGLRHRHRVEVSNPFAGDLPPL